MVVLVLGYALIQSWANSQICPVWTKLSFSVKIYFLELFSFSAWDKLHDPGANWSKLEHM